jgi:serine O-acetyltransferase
MLQNVRQDFQCCGTTFRERLREMLINLGMWAVLGYRFRRWVCTAGIPRWLRWPFTLAALGVQMGVEITTSIQLSVAARIGPGLYIPHLGTIVVGSGSTIGSHCILCHGVTLGHRGGGRYGSHAGNPDIGDRVYLGPGSSILGPITVGDDAVIGVSAVVTRSVPPRAVVAGIPARILSRNGSFDLIRYPGMERDPSRLASFALRTPAMADDTLVDVAALAPLVNQR